MKHLTTILLFASIVSFAQTKKETDTTTYNLGPVFENILQQQEELKKQFESAEQSKQAFIVGYFSGKGRVLTERDSVVYVTPSKLRILKKKK